MPFGAEYAEREGWAPLQRAYVRMLGIVDLPTRIRARTILPILAQLPAGRVIDFGAGTGVYAFLLSRRSDLDVVAVDVDDERVKEISSIASKLGRNMLSVVRADEEFFTSTRCGRADAIIASEVLLYCTDIDETLAAMYECLSPGGMLIAHTAVRHDLRPYERHKLNEARLAPLLRRVGFEEVEILATFGRRAQLLCAVFEKVSRRRIALAFVFPLLLLATKVIPCHPRQGHSLLAVACKAGTGGTSRPPRQGLEGATPAAPAAG